MGTELSVSVFPCPSDTLPGSVIRVSSTRGKFIHFSLPVHKETFSPVSAQADFHREPKNDFLVLCALLLNPHGGALALMNAGFHAAASFCSRGACEHTGCPERARSEGSHFRTARGLCPLEPSPLPSGEDGGTVGPGWGASPACPVRGTESGQHHSRPEMGHFECKVLRRAWLGDTEPLGFDV